MKKVSFVSLMTLGLGLLLAACGDSTSVGNSAAQVAATTGISSTTTAATTAAFSPSPLANYVYYRRHCSYRAFADYPSF